ncbi:MAG: SDR family NAD(P)-dependent oxidoreductase [Aquabacterium sp.]|uniref:SDR family NAD(P)-dependent oxidoreductase n=1 Tax=Aquabacterium sp. TaxID=1872578 RepID=UPI003BD69B56
MKLAECVVLVTGGSSGLGEAVANMAHQQGARVIVADRVAPRPESQLRQADPEGLRWHWQETDVSDETQAEQAVAAAMSRFGRLDALVNAAGVAVVEKLQGREGPHRLSSFQRALTVNLMGSFNMMRLAVPAMLQSPEPEGRDALASRGVIINTASVAAFDGQIGQVAYAASKGGVVAMTLPAARELARDRIRVMTIAPGVFMTPMMASLPEAAQASLAATVPHPSRLGQPEEFAALVRHIVENDYLNGEVIRLDASLRMAPR